MKSIKIRRYDPGYYTNCEMFQSTFGGWVPYTDYCRMVSRLTNKISRLEETIVRTRMREVGVSEQ